MASFLTTVKTYLHNAALYLFSCLVLGWLLSVSPPNGSGVGGAGGRAVEVGDGVEGPVLVPQDRAEGSVAFRVNGSDVLPVTS